MKENLKNVNEKLDKKNEGMRLNSVNSRSGKTRLWMICRFTLKTRDL